MAKDWTGLLAIKTAGKVLDGSTVTVIAFLCSSALRRRMGCGNPAINAGAVMALMALSRRRRQRAYYAGVDVSVLKRTASARRSFRVSARPPPRSRHAVGDAKIFLGAAQGRPHELGRPHTPTRSVWACPGLVFILCVYAFLGIPLGRRATKASR